MGRAQSAAGVAGNNFVWLMQNKQQGCGEQLSEGPGGRGTTFSEVVPPVHLRRFGPNDDLQVARQDEVLLSVSVPRVPDYAVAATFAKNQPVAWRRRTSRVLTHYLLFSEH